jgi:broad specificity phosphatase PhoE
MQLILLRHGECLGQCDPALGSEPDTPLSERGRRQAKCAAQALADAKITHILSSPLLRSLETAHLIAEHLQLEQIAVWTTLREMWSTRHRGAQRTALQQRFPRTQLPPDIRDDEWWYTPDDHATMIARADQVLLTIGKNYDDDDRILIVSHGFALNFLLHRLLGIADMTLHLFDLANCGISTMQLIPEHRREQYAGFPAIGVEISCINDISHLVAAGL